jgi:hypothetical protein
LVGGYFKGETQQRLILGTDPDVSFLRFDRLFVWPAATLNVEPCNLG